MRKNQPDLYSFSGSQFNLIRSLLENHKLLTFSSACSTQTTPGITKLLNPMSFSVQRKNVRPFLRHKAHHRLNGSPSHVLMGTSLSYGKAKNSTPHRIKAPDLIEIKFGMADYVG